MSCKKVQHLASINGIMVSMARRSLFVYVGKIWICLGVDDGGSNWIYVLSGPKLGLLATITSNVYFRVMIRLCIVRVERREGGGKD